jgi:hypothetical protein
VLPIIKHVNSCVHYILFSQLFVAAMGPPGGGRNDITSRFTRHLNVVSIDEFDDTTMTRIFTSITDWHFANFEGSFVRNGKVRYRNKWHFCISYIFVN